MTSVRRAWWWTLGLSVTSSVLVVVVPELRVGLESVRVRTGLETAQSLVGLLVGLLVFGRYRRTGRAADLVVAYALFVSASTNMLLELIPAGDRGIDPQSFRTWARLLSRTLTGAALAWAALAEGLTIGSSIRRPTRALWLAVTASVTGVLAFTWLLRHPLPPGTDVLLVDHRLEPVSSEPLVLAAQVVVIGLYAAASAGFLLQAERDPEPLKSALAVGLLLGAASWGLFLVYPTVFTDVVQLGDVLRLAFYLVLAYGAEREIHDYWSRVVRSAALEERRRIARDLHDGLAQELAFVSRSARLLERGDAPDGMERQLVSASDRALDEARRAITALTTSGDEPLADALAAAAEDVASRVGTTARVDVDDSVHVPPADREALLRIVREAIANAARHGAARSVTVELRDDRVLRITDDGSGFDPAAPTRPGRFGLVSMRERSEGIGATLTLTSSPGRGTMVEVHLR